MPRGGKREGRQGEAYSNRTDLNQTTVRQGSLGSMPGAARPYGSADDGASLPPGPSEGGAVGLSAPPASGPPPIQPGGLLPLDAPTTRPDEPITAGLYDQPQPLTPDDPHETLRAIYAVFPHEDIRRLLEGA